ncbi:MAG: hypothetical protein WC765_02300 [Phycisphaerae bacterium]|jgi:hypothetical protein
MKTKILTQISLAVILTALTFGLISCKGKPASFGEPISDKTITPIRSIATAPADYNDKNITVKGKIILECPAGGWFDLQQDAAILHVDLHPTGFAIPQKVGSVVTAQGTLKVKDNYPTLVGTGVEIK